MAKTVVFHIGDPKTGTSSIQQVLMDQAYRSETLSVDYQPYLNAFPLANSLAEPEKAHNRAALFGVISAWLATSKTDVSIISAEMFFRVDPVVMQQALDEFLPEHAASARFVAYVRPHAARFLSQFVQISKTGMYWGDMNTLFDRMVKKETLLYHQRFLAWRRVFGDRFTLRPMVRSELHGQDVVADFFNVALQGAPFTLLNTGSFNESPSLEVLTGVREMQRVFNRNGVPLEVRQAVGQYMVNKLNAAANGQGTKLRVSKEILDRLQAHCQADAAAMDADFLGGSILQNALSGARKDSVDAALPLAVKRCYPPESLAKLRRVSERLAKLFNEDGALWRAEFFRQIKQRPDSDTLRQQVEHRAMPLKNINGALDRLTGILTTEFHTLTYDEVAALPAASIG
jgi:hypothetical protein